MKKQNKLINKITKSIIIALLLAILSTYFIGNYFVNYALVPHSGGNNRKVAQTYKMPPQIVNIQEANKKQQEQQSINWQRKFTNNEQKIKSDDGNMLYGHTFTHLQTDKWIVIVHGYQSKEEKSYPIAQHFYDKGYNVLTISLRAHGKSEGKYITMGVKEKDDLIKWTQHIIQQNPHADITYHGTSMGAATVLMAAGEFNDSHLTKVIADSGYSSVWEIFKSELHKRFSLPSFPILDMSSIVAKVKTGHSLKEGNVTKYTPHIKAKVLLIHSKTDDFVPEYMAEQIYNTINTKKQKYITDYADHADIKFAYPTQYYNTIDKFMQE